MVVTFLIAVFATATIFAEVAAAQQPITPAAKNDQNPGGLLYYPLGHWYFPPPIHTPGRPGPVNPPPVWVEP